MSGCRIRSVKMKAGGEVRRLPIVERDEAQKLLATRAAVTASHFKPGEMTGYVIFAWDKDGCTSVGYYYNDKSRVRARLLPSFIADALRDRMIEEGDWGKS